MNAWAVNRRVSLLLLSHRVLVLFFFELARVLEHFPLLSVQSGVTRRWNCALAKGLDGSTRQGSVQKWEVWGRLR